MFTQAGYAQVLGIIAITSVIPVVSPASEATDTITLANGDTRKVYEVEESVIERTRANRPMSPVAFSEISTEEMARVSYGQDVPLVLSALPSVYA